MLVTCPSACGLCSQLERFYRTGSEAAESHHTRDSTRSPDALPECRHRRREGRAMSTARSSAARLRRFGGRAQGECGDPRLAVCICRWWVASWTGPLVFSLRVRRHRVSRAVARGGRADHQTHIQSLTLSRLVSLVGCRGVAMTHERVCNRMCARYRERGFTAFSFHRVYYALVFQPKAHTTHKRDKSHKTARAERGVGTKRRDSRNEFQQSTGLASARACRHRLSVTECYCDSFHKSSSPAQRLGDSRPFGAQLRL